MRGRVRRVHKLCTNASRKAEVEAVRLTSAAQLFTHLVTICHHPNRLEFGSMLNNGKFTGADRSRFFGIARG